MKTCPHCGGLIRPSVIKCVHCGMTCVEDNEAAGSDAGVRGSDGAPVPVVGASGLGRSDGAAYATRTIRTSADTPGHALTADPWGAPSVRAEERVRRSMRAIPSTTSAGSARVRHIDPALVLGGVLAIAGAAASASSIALPWVLGRLTVIGQRGTTRVVTELSFEASDSVAHAIVLGVAVGAGLLGLLWFWYGLDRGAHLPGFAHPGLGVLASAAAWATVGASRLGAFFWEDAFVARARDAGLTKDAMRAVLEDTDARILAFQQQAGMTRLMLSAGLVLAAAVVAWCSQRDR